MNRKRNQIIQPQLNTTANEFACHVKEEIKEEPVRYPYSTTAGFWCSEIRYRRASDNKIVLFIHSVPKTFQCVQYVNFIVGSIYKYYSERGRINFLFVVDRIEGDTAYVTVIKDFSKDDLDWTGQKTEFLISDGWEAKYIKKVKKEDLPLELLK